MPSLQVSVLPCCTSPGSCPSQVHKQTTVWLTPLFPCMRAQICQGQHGSDWASLESTISHNMHRCLFMLWCASHSYNAAYYLLQKPEYSVAVTQTALALPPRERPWSATPQLPTHQHSLALSQLLNRPSHPTELERVHVKPPCGHVARPFYSATRAA